MKVSINGVSYFYKDEGKGEVILFVHGNPDSANYWDGVIEVFKEKYRCIAPDLPGFGRSEVEKNFDFTLSYGSKWINDFLAAINISSSVHLIVHDIGGFFGLPWAIEHPDKIKSICVHNSIFFSDYKWHFWGRIWRTKGLGELTRYVLSRWFYKFNLKQSSPALTEAYLNESFELGIANGKMIGPMLHIYRAMTPSVFKGWEDSYLQLTTEKPCIVIWGDNDPYIPPKFKFAERFANGNSLYRIPKAGHWAAAEYPKLFAEYWINQFAKI